MKSQAEGAQIEAKYRLLFDNIADAVLIFDKQSYRFLDCNHAVSRIYGYSKDEIRRMTPFDLHRPGDREQVKRKIDVRNLTDANTYVHVTKDGTEMHVEILTDETSYEGRPAWISIIRNISEHKQVEEHLLRAKEAAEAASRAKGEFLANVSHEIRTPMGGIIGLTDLVLNTTLTAEQSEYLGMIKRSANSLLAVIDDILDGSRIESGTIELNTIDFAFRNTFVDALETLGVQAAQKGLDFDCSVAPDVPDDLHGDVSRLRQILVNLVGNAIKYTDAGGITARVTSAAQGETDTLIHVAVTDTGIGIPADRLGRIFEAFSQVDASLARRHGGTGLGLAISKSLVEIMGGEIWSESVPGEGSTFHFTLRFGVRRTAAPEVQAVKADLHGVPVLVVDGNAVSRSDLMETLRAWGMSIGEAENADQAIAAMARPPEIGATAPRVLIVAHTARDDGFAVAEKVRRHGGPATTSVIILSELGRIGDGALCRRLGVDGYLTRPVGETDLRATIAVLVGSEKDGARPQLVTRHTLRESRSMTDAVPSVHLKILIAEDNPVNQLVIRRILEKSGQDVTVASNGKQALDAISQGAFDLVLMDLQMPEMDGIEATAAVREAEQSTGGHLPIVALTAHAMVGDRERCLAAGMDSYLAKPVKRRELLDLIARVSASAEGLNQPPFTSRLA